MLSQRRAEPPEALVRALQALLVLAFLGVWEVSSDLSPQAHFFFSQPTAIAVRLASWLASPDVWVDLAVTLVETVLGFLGGTVLGLALAFLCYGSRLAERVLMPFFGVANAMPRLVFGPIFVLWFGLGLTSKVVLGLSLVTFLVLFSTFQGLREVDPALILRVRLLGGTPRDVLRHVLVPSALTWVFTSLRTSVGFALVGAVVGEYTGAAHGIGHRIDFAEGMFDSTGIFAGLALLCAMVLALDQVLDLVERRFRPGAAHLSLTAWRLPALLTVLALVVGLAVRSTVLLREEPPPTLIRVTVASAGVSLMGNLPAELADSQGWFRQEGLDVTMQDLKGGAAAAKALIGGSAEFACLALDHALKARAQGEDLVLLATYTRYPGLTLVVDSRLADRVRTVADLKGTRVGVTSLGSGSHLALQALLVKNGLALADVDALAVGIGTMPAALEQGSIQAAMHYDPFVTQLLEEKRAFALVDLTGEEGTRALYGSDYPYLGLMTRRDVIRDKPDLCQKMVNAVVVAQRFLQSRSAEQVARVLPPEFTHSGGLFVRALQHTAPGFSPDGVVTEEEVRTVLRSLQATGALPADLSLDPAAVLDMSFLRRAQGR